jgi:hypothetical protein
LAIQAEIFFFKHDIQNAIGGGGASALVTRAITGTDDSPIVVHPKDVNFHVSICKFVRMLSRSEQVAFAEIISLSEDVVKDRYCRDKDATVSSNLKDLYLPSQLPTNYNFIDRTYIRGKYALLQCLPYPSVKKVVDHGYVSGKDNVSHLLAFSSKYRCMMTSDIAERLNSHVHHISESDAVREVLGRAAIACGGNDIVVLFCMEWSDDFDPATSSKQNHRSCWIKTITVLPGYCTYQKIGESSTFPIAIGKKNSNHQCVEKLFSDEMTELRSGNFKCYNKHTGSFVHVYMEIVASLQDQPEQRSCNALMLGYGKYSSRWGFTGDLATVAHHIPSCVACVRQNK